MKIFPLIFLVCCSWLAPCVSQAHTELVASNPIAGAVLPESPATIELTFSEDVQLLRLVIADKNAGEVAIGFKPSAVSQPLFSVSMPVLTEDTFTVSWAVLGKDGHRVEKSFSFTVDTSALPTSAPAAQSPTAHSH
jgi:copper resistance protein C